MLAIEYLVFAFVIILRGTTANNVRRVTRLIFFVLQMEPKKGIALMNGDGARLNFTFIQTSPFLPTTSYITGRQLNLQGGNFHVHALPKTPQREVRRLAAKS